MAEFDYSDGKFEIIAGPYFQILCANTAYRREQRGDFSRFNFCLPSALMKKDNNLN